MKKTILLIFAFYTLISAFGQDIKEVINKFPKTEQIESKYFVLQSDTTIKHGQFLKFKETNVDSSILIVKGQFGENVKKGIWTWFDNSGAAKKVYDFDNVKYIKGNQYIASNVHYPVEAIENNIQGIVTVRYSVDCDCNVIDTVVVKGLGYGCDESAVSSIIDIYIQLRETGYPCDAISETKDISFKIQ